MAKGVCVLLGALIGCMLAFPGDAARAALEGLSMWAGKVLPTLFPMLVCMLLLTSRVRKTPLLCAGLGLLSGSPGGARLCAALPISAQQKRRLAALTGTMSPMFLLSTVPAFLGDERLGVPLLFCHLGGAVLTGLILFPRHAAAPVQVAPPAPLSLGQAIADAAQSMMTVGGCIVLGTVASRMLLCALPGMPEGFSILLQTVTEVTGGLYALSQSGLPHQPLLSVMAASFGGLSIQMQNAAFWQKGGVGVMRLCLYRGAHALLSGLLFALLCRPFI